MKKWIFLLLFIPAIVWAGFSVDGVTDPASVDSVAEPASVEGVTSDYSSCPPWYADTNVTFSWDGNHSSGADYGCLSGGTSIQATTNPTIDTGTSYGEGGGDIGVRLSETDAGLSFANTTNQLLDVNGTYTICVRAYYTDSTPTPEVGICEAAGNTTPGQNWLGIYADNVAGTYVARYEAQNDSKQKAEASELPADTWSTIGISYDTSSIPDGDLSTWDHSASQWNENTDVLDTAFADDATYFMIGELNAARSAPDSGEYIYVTSIAIINSYQADCESLTGW